MRRRGNERDAFNRDSWKGKCGENSREMEERRLFRKKYVTRPFSPFPCTFRGAASGGAGKKTTPIGIPEERRTDGNYQGGEHTYMGKRKGKGGEIFQSGGAKCPLFLLFF